MESRKDLFSASHCDLPCHTGESFEFGVTIDPTTDAERAYLAAMASLGAGPYGSGDVAAAMDKTTAQVGPHRDTLIKRGLCYSPRYGVIAFTVPMFDQFVRRWLG